MPNLRCSICKNDLAKRMVNDALRDGMAAATISRQFEGVGATVTAATILRHRKHWRDGEPVAPEGTPKHDIAIIIRDAMADRIQRADGDEMDALLFTKEGQGALTVGLRAGKQIEDRDKAKAKGLLAEVGQAWLEFLTSNSVPTPPPALDDGMTIDGEAHEVAEDEEPEDDDGSSD